MPEGVPATIQSPWQAMASSGAAGSQPSECCSLTLYPTEFSMSSGAENFRSGQSWQPEPQAGPSSNMKPVPDVILFVHSCATGKKCPSPSPWTTTYPIHTLVMHEHELRQWNQRVSHGSSGAALGMVRNHKASAATTDTNTWNSGGAQLQDGRAF